MGYECKQLTPDDLPEFRQLMKILGEAFDEPETYLDKAPDDGYVRGLLAKPDFIALAAVSGGEVVGGLAAYVLHKYEQARSEVYVYDLAVAEPHRRKGIATGLINALKKIAKSKDAWVMFVQADPGDDPAISLYTKMGTREDVHHFDIGLD